MKMRREIARGGKFHGIDGRSDRCSCQELVLSRYVIIVDARPAAHRCVADHNALCFRTSPRSTPPPGDAAFPIARESEPASHPKRRDGKAIGVPCVVATRSLVEDPTEDAHDRPKVNKQPGPRDLGASTAPNYSRQL